MNMLPTPPGSTESTPAGRNSSFPSPPPRRPVFQPQAHRSPFRGTTSIVKPNKIARGTWERLKPRINVLYVEENRPLVGRDGVIKVMESQYGFFASESQYRAQLRKWEMKKNKANMRDVNRSQTNTRILPSIPGEHFFQAAPRLPIMHEASVTQATDTSLADACTNTALLSLDTNNNLETSMLVQGLPRKPRVKSEKRSQSMTIWWAERKARLKEHNRHRNNLHDRVAVSSTSVPSHAYQPSDSTYCKDPKLYPFNPLEEVTECNPSEVTDISIINASTSSLLRSVYTPGFKVPSGYEWDSQVSDFIKGWPALISPTQPVSEAKIQLDEKATEISSAKAQMLGDSKSESGVFKSCPSSSEEAEAMVEDWKHSKESIFESPKGIGSWGYHKSSRLESSTDHSGSTEDPPRVANLRRLYYGGEIIRQSRSKNDPGMWASLDELMTQHESPPNPTPARPFARITKPLIETAKGQSRDTYSSVSSHLPSTFVLSAKLQNADDLEEPRTTSPAETFHCTPQNPEADKDIKHWVDGTKGAESVPVFTPSYPDATPSASNSPIVDLTGSLEETAPPPSRNFVLELLDILYAQTPDELDSHEEENTSPGCCFSPDADTTDMTESPGDANDQSGSSSSPKSSTTSRNASGRPPSFKRPYQQDWEISEGQDDDEPPSKKPNREQGPSVADDKTSFLNELLMPCPLRESQKCLGTNPTISELLRCLSTNHQVVICIECCTLLEFPIGGSKVEEVLSDHKGSEDCVRRCISQSCAGNIGPYHLRTPKCPSLRRIPNELWRFIWTLVNRGQEAPVLQFSTGIGCLHDRVRRPRTRRANDKTKPNRAQEIAQKIKEDLESKEDRIRVLEIELKAANDRLIHIQREHDDRLQECTRKTSEQDEIILDLLERLIKSGSPLELSLQKRLKRVCPDVFQEAGGGAKATPSNLPPTPDSVVKSTPLNTPSKIPSTSELPLHENGCIPPTAAPPLGEHISMDFSSMPHQQIFEDASQPSSARSKWTMEGLFGIGKDCDTDGLVNNGHWLHDLNEGPSNGML